MRNLQLTKMLLSFIGVFCVQFRIRKGGRIRKKINFVRKEMKTEETGKKGEAKIERKKERKERSGD